MPYIKLWEYKSEFTSGEFGTRINILMGINNNISFRKTKIMGIQIMGIEMLIFKRGKFSLRKFIVLIILYMGIEIMGNQIMGIQITRIKRLRIQTSKGQKIIDRMQI